MELMKLIGLGWRLKKNEIFPETEKEVQIVVKSNIIMRYKSAYLTLQLVESVDEDPINLVQISKLTHGLLNISRI
jgi:hypothetical protein